MIKEELIVKLQALPDGTDICTEHLGKVLSINSVAQTSMVRVFDDKHKYELEDYVSISKAKKIGRGLVAPIGIAVVI